VVQDRGTAAAVEGEGEGEGEVSKFSNLLCL
jgi:hypothetical protein